MPRTLYRRDFIKCKRKYANADNWKFRVFIGDAEIFTNDLTQAKHIKKNEGGFIDYYDKIDCCWRPLRQMKKAR